MWRLANGESAPDELAGSKAHTNPARPDQQGTKAGGYKRVRAKPGMSYAVLRVMATSEALLLKRNFTRLLREGAGNAAPRAPAVQGEKKTRDK